MVLIRKSTECTNAHTMEFLKKEVGTMPEWISVKERLPEPGERVLYCYRGFVGEGYVTRSGEWERAGIWTRYYPSHWMPLPEPPEEGDEADGNYERTVCGGAAD